VEPLLATLGKEKRTAYDVDKIFISLYVQDGFYANCDFSSFSTVEKHGYIKFSDLMKNKYSGYCLD